MSTDSKRGKTPPAFVTAGAIAGDASVCPNTARSRLALAGVIPDGVLVGGSRRKPLPIYAANRVQELKAAIHAGPQHIA
jgi:hypothetical protein